MRDLKLGVIGLSAGNGHPYSWSAIFNGFDAAAMSACPFPVIPDYLNRQNFPDDAIAGARVTHIWTQDRMVSDHVAAASRIETVLDDKEQMIGEVDAVLLARDDAETHLEMARPFLKAGLPVYIDKPLAYTVKEARTILALEIYPGQIFTCSGLRYARELYLTEEQRREIGPLKKITGVVPKDWRKYAIHVIEPILAGEHHLGLVLTKCVEHLPESTILTVRWSSGIETSFQNMGSAPSPILIRYEGERGVLELRFNDTFAAFKRSLEGFMMAVAEKRRVIALDDTLSFVQMIEWGVQT